MTSEKLKTLPTMNDSSLHLVTRTILPVLLGMCSEPDKLVVTETEDPKREYQKIIVIKPSRTDAGVLYGGASRQILAIQHVFATAFARCGIKAKAKIEQSYEGEKNPLPRYRFNPEFERTSNFTHVFAKVLNAVFDKPPLIERKEVMDRDSGDPCLVVIVHGDAAEVSALADMFYPFGIRQGMKLKIRPPKLYDQTTRNNPLQRTSAISR